jgi:hypothetical protein
LFDAEDPSSCGVVMRFSGCRIMNILEVKSILMNSDCSDVNNESTIKVKAKFFLCLIIRPRRHVEGLEAGSSLDSRWA